MLEVRHAGYYICDIEVALVLLSPENCEQQAADYFHRKYGSVLDLNEL